MIDRIVVQKVNDYFDSHHDEIIAMWKDFVDTKSSTLSKEESDNMALLLAKTLREAGCEDVKLNNVGEKTGPVVTAIIGKERPGKPVLFTGHFDTVPLKGDYPFYIDENNCAHGLGCLDMKGGIVMSIWIAKALKEVGWAERPICFMFAGDEEYAHMYSNAKEFLLKHGGNYIAAFNMETGLESNAICVGRKGTGQAVMTVHGIGAHSGNNFTEGRSAILEMAYKVPEIEALTDLDKKSTVAVTMIEGGTVSNSIAPICKATIDLRYGSPEEKSRIADALNAICKEQFVDGTSTEIEFRDFLMPLGKENGTEELAEFIAQTSEDYGFGKMGTVFLGGGSDAGYIQNAGTPVVCSMGVVGRFNHTKDEYAHVDSIFERGKLLTLTVLHIDELNCNHQ